MSDSLIITFDSDGDGAALLVGRKIFDLTFKLEIINEFTGDDAVSLYNLLTKKENKDGLKMLL